MNRWVSGRQEDGERGRQVYVLVSESDEDATSSSSQLSVQHGIQDWIVALHVLHEQWVAKTQRTLEVLAECIVQETVHIQPHNEVNC